MAAQADGQSMLRTVGETRNVQLSQGAHVSTFDALIIRDLGSDIIVGEPFLEHHDIGVRSTRKQIIIRGRDIISYAQHDSPSSPITHRIFTFLCRAPSSSTTILPGEYISVLSLALFQTMILWSVNLELTHIALLLGYGQKSSSLLLLVVRFISLMKAMSLFC